jgi:hypothetical protein
LLGARPGDAAIEAVGVGVVKAVRLDVVDEVDDVERRFPRREAGTAAEHLGVKDV